MSSAITMSGHVDVHVITPAGDVVPESSGSNTTLYACADAVARMCAGDDRARPAKIVIAYNKQGAKGQFNYTANIRTSVTVADVVTNGMSTYEVDVTGSGKLSAAEGQSNYHGNTVTLSGVTGDDFNALNLAKVDGDDVNTGIHGYLLVAADGTVLAVRKPNNRTTKSAGYGMLVSWKLTFN